jgi:AraC-like DNA-binding protein
VTEIAFKVGFQSASHFGQAFRAHMSVSPTQWRRRNLA